MKVVRSKVQAYGEKKVTNAADVLLRPIKLGKYSGDKFVSPATSKLKSVNKEKSFKVNVKKCDSELDSQESDGAELRNVSNWQQELDKTKDKVKKKKREGIGVKLKVVGK